MFSLHRRNKASEEPLLPQTVASAYPERAPRVSSDYTDADIGHVFVTAMWLDTLVVGVAIGIGGLIYACVNNGLGWDDHPKDPLRAVVLSLLAFGATLLWVLICVAYVVREIKEFSARDFVARDSRTAFRRLAALVFVLLLAECVGVWSHVDKTCQALAVVFWQTAPRWDRNATQERASWELPAPLEDGRVYSTADWNAGGFKNIACVVTLPTLRNKWQDVYPMAYPVSVHDHHCFGSTTPFTLSKLEALNARATARWGHGKSITDVCTWTLTNHETCACTDVERVRVAVPTGSWYQGEEYLDDFTSLITVTQLIQLQVWCKSDAWRCS